MAVPELRPMGVGDILDVTFRLYRQQFLTFLLIALTVYVPYALLLAVSQPFQQSKTLQHAGAVQTAGVEQGETKVVWPPQNQQAWPPKDFNPLGFALSMIGFAAFVIVLLPLCTAALVQNISASYLGEVLTAAQSYSRAAPRLIGLIGTQILVFLAIMGGYLLCIVPGVIFSLWFLLIVPVVILESRVGPSALGRSRELMRGNLGKGFMIGLVVGIFVFMVSWILGMLTPLVPWPHPAVGLFVQTVLLALILPIQTAPWILFYYDLRIRKEAFDLQMLSMALGQPEANQPLAT
jgi:hypothetical protein